MVCFVSLPGQTSQGKSDRATSTTVEPSTTATRRISTVARIVATHSLLPRTRNRLIPVAIPNPLLHNPLNSLAITRIYQ
jgi:hypothetical protein